MSKNWGLFLYAAYKQLAHGCCLRYSICPVNIQLVSEENSSPELPSLRLLFLPTSPTYLIPRLNWILDRSGKFFMKKYPNNVNSGPGFCFLFLVSIALVRPRFWVFCFASYYWLVFILLFRSGPSIDSMQNWRTRSKLSRKCIPNSGAHGPEQLASALWRKPRSAPCSTQPARRGPARLRSL